VLGVALPSAQWQRSHNKWQWKEDRFCAAEEPKPFLRKEAKLSLVPLCRSGSGFGFSKGAAQAEPSQTHHYYVIIIHYSMYPK
jgi:hypothetical protein